MKKHTHHRSGIESPFTDGIAGGVPGMTDAPGVYDTHPNIGPAATKGGLPVKLIDTSVPGVMPSGASHGVHPTGQKTPKA